MHGDSSQGLLRWSMAVVENAMMRYPALYLNILPECCRRNHPGRPPYRLGTWLDQD
jgi:hypothetical protein